MKHKDLRRRRAWLVAIASLLPAFSARSQPSAADWVGGSIVRIDAEAGKITLRHGGVRHLYLPPGDTTFRYTEARWINGRRAGDRVVFRADRIELELRLTGLAYVGG